MTLPIKTKTSVLKVLIHIITSIAGPSIRHIITSIVAPPITHTVILVIMFVSTFKTCRYSIFRRQAGYEILS